MLIPVFVSCPSDLSPAQDAARKIILELLQDMRLEPRALGRSDYPTELPLREVAVIARHCSGGVILGFEQFRAEAGAGTWKHGVAGKELKTADVTVFPTPWNQLEAGILFGLHLPLLIFREPGITGGVFDAGVTDVFVHRMPDGAASASTLDSLRDVFLKWHAKVSEHYYRFGPLPRW